jgi:hypothetical protein
MSHSYNTRSKAHGIEIVRKYKSSDENIKLFILNVEICEYLIALGVVPNTAANRDILAEKRREIDDVDNIHYTNARVNYKKRKENEHMLEIYLGAFMPLLGPFKSRIPMKYHHLFDVAADVYFIQ